MSARVEPEWAMVTGAVVARGQLTLKGKPEPVSVFAPVPLALRNASRTPPA